MRLALLAIAFAVTLFAQTTTTTTTNTTSPTTTTTSAAGTTTATTTGPNTTMDAIPGVGRHAVMITGRVMIDDSSELPTDVSIESVCTGTHRTQAHVAGNGAFSFLWSNTTTSFGDASQVFRVARTRNSRVDPMANCELIAAAGGYSSSSVDLTNRSAQDTFDAGTIVLHRADSGDGHAVSLLALKAPKDAKKFYDRGVALFTTAKYQESANALEKAVAAYPEYADAWVALGKAQRQLEKMDAAETSYKKAMDLDPKLVGAWQELGYLDCVRAKWTDAVRFLDMAVRLDPTDSATAWYYDAVANYNSGHMEAAERAIRAERKFDQGRNPLSDYMFGLILIARKDYEAAAAALRNFLAVSPQSADAPVARRELAKIESRAL